MKRYFILITLSIITAGLAVSADPLLASTERLYTHFDSETIIRGYTAEYNQPAAGDWGEFRVAIVPNLVTEPIYLEVKKFSGDNLPDPAGLTRVSDYYIYDILREDQANKEPLKLQRPFILSVKLNGDLKNYYRKRVYYWNKPTESWVPLPSSADYDRGYIRAYTHLPFSRIAVFEDSNAISNYSLEGRASFLSWPSQPDGVASNDYPLGTRLRVRNVDNGKTVDVTVRSTGPFHPFCDRRIVDLSRTAFVQIEDPWKGLARVQVWPIGEGVKVLGVDTYVLRDELPGAAESVQSTEETIPDPVIHAKSVIVINEKTEEIIYSKNYDQVMPIASLTKLMTAAVFLDTNTPFENEIAYQPEDNAIGAKLYANYGDTMTVKDVYYTMLVGSANNAANMLARSTGLTRDQFVKKMNDQAAAWGLKNTHFNDVTGLDTGNVSTVYELALMTKRILADFRVLQGTTTPAYGFRTINTDIPHTIRNSAKGVFETGYIDSSLYITGMKTGYLDEAGYCFMLKARREKGSDNHAIAVVLGADSDRARYEDANALINYALEKI